MATPLPFDEGMAAIICEEIASGKSLRSICKERDDIPGMTTVFKWLSENTDFAKQYAHAREAQADALAEETLEIADDGSNDWIERNDQKNAGYEANGEHIQRSRLRVDARKWFASKVAPKKYGDKIQNEHTGPEGGPILQRIERVIVDPANPDSAGVYAATGPITV